ncbi:MAG: phenylalanine--tRNA ligase subunit beta [Peptococcaceae bacterium]|nr:phenylalanine--tRNA ligase subunit beta [Peptococcaceae bacterium]
MRVSFNWLKEFVDIPVGPEELAEKLTQVGLAVEGLEQPGKEVQGVVTARINEVKPHPNADRLVICIVTDGEQEYIIVTGAPNVEEGQIVPLAKVGARLAGGIVLKKAKLRGVESVGMLCAADELGIGEDHEGILILPPDTPIGQDVNPLLGLDDTILELDLTPNRGDCLSIIGVAREVAAIFGSRLKSRCPAFPEIKDTIEGKVRVDIEDPNLCRRYVARMVQDIKIGPSPIWMQTRLSSMGVRPINNIVDVTNYVMLELGQPLHAFDYSTIAGGHIIVRRAVNGERIVTLDGKERQLDSEMLVIADEQKAVGIAGVMGGFNSEVTDNTTAILLESAFFDPASIRRTSRLLGLRSEASLRFEKGIDLEGCARAADRAAELIHQIGGGKVVSAAIDEYPRVYTPKTITVRPARVNDILGVTISVDEMKGILTRLNFNPREDKGHLLVTVPSYRTDIDLEIDLIEEIARLHGYNNVPDTLPFGAGTMGVRTDVQNKEKMVRELLASCGLNEVITYSFIDPKMFDKLRLDEQDALRNAVRLQNPLSEEQSVMRTLLLPGLLDVLARNYYRRNTDVAVFEIGRIFIPSSDFLPEEHLSLGCAVMGQTDGGWKHASRQRDFYYLKGIVEVLMMRLGISQVSFVKDENRTSYHPGRTARVMIAGEEAGVIGEVHPDVLEAFDLPTRVVACEIDLEKILNYGPVKTRFQELPRYPSVDRDLSLLVKKEISCDEVTKVIWQSGKKLLRHVNLFDVYEGEQIPQDWRSLTFSLKFQARDRTLTDEEVTKTMERIVHNATQQLGAQVRGK